MDYLIQSSYEMGYVIKLIFQTRQLKHRGMNNPSKLNS